MDIKKFKEYKINEDFNKQVEKKLTNKYLSLKKGVILLIEESLQDDEREDLAKLEKIIKKINKDGVENVNLIGFIEINDINNFYLKFQNDIDEILKDAEYFNTTPKENLVFSLSDFIVDGTKKAINYISEIIEKEIFKFSS